jgi:hypothetical protein
VLTIVAENPTGSVIDYGFDDERDGTIPLEAALGAFALAVGPLPGVETPSGDAPPISSASGATRWLIGHWAALTPEQQAAAAALLGLPDQAATTGLTASLGTVRAAAAAPSCAVEPSGPKVDELRAKLDEVQPQISEKLKRPLGIPVVFTLGDVPDRPGIAANTVPLDATCGPAQARPAYCQIQVTNRGQGLTGFAFTHLVAHEVFHCFQYDLATSAQASGRVPAWLAEGSAAWVGEVISFGSTLGEEYWETWLKEPQKPLFEHAYGGIGFFMHLAESGIDPWPILVSMHRKGESSSIDAYSVAVKGSPAQRMIDAWGPSFIRDTTTLGPDWSMGGPGLPAYVRTPVSQEAVGSSDSYILSASPQAAWASRLDVQSDVVVLKGRSSRGLVRFADGSQHALKDVLGKPFCTKPGGCSCSAGSPGARHTWMSAPKGEMLIGVSGHTDGAHVFVEGYDVDPACDQSPDDFRPAEPCWCPPGPLGSVREAPARLALVR